MKEPIFLNPVLQTKIWGGKKLATQFGMTLPNDTIGESWSISAHPEGVSTIRSPKRYEGMKFDQFYQENLPLFGENPPATFPLLVKILDAAQDLSVQVHPDDTYGLTHEGELGKTECWYVISAEEGAKIIYGHNAETREAFADAVEKGDWDNLLREVPVKAGDFFDVPHGTMHAIGAGIVILETQQNSDTTYRVYDYDRKDDEGNPRKLHIQQALDVTRFPHTDPELNVVETVYGNSQLTHFLTNELFSVYKWEVDGDLVVDLLGAYHLATVIAGDGELEIDGQSYPLQLADSFVLPADVRSVTVRGKMTLIVSNPE